MESRFVFQFSIILFSWYFVGFWDWSKVESFLMLSFFTGSVDCVNFTSTSSAHAILELFHALSNSIIRGAFRTSAICSAAQFQSAASPNTHRKQQSGIATERCRKSRCARTRASALG
jgi:hypothetical protein